MQLPEIVQAGIDTVSFYLCLEGSPAVEKISRLPGKTRLACGGTMLGEHCGRGRMGAYLRLSGYLATGAEAALSVPEVGSYRPTVPHR